MTIPAAAPINELTMMLKNTPFTPVAAPIMIKYFIW
jgi:hypothetical protein